MSNILCRICVAGLASVGFGSGITGAEELNLRIITSGNVPVFDAEVTLGYATRRPDNHGLLHVEVPHQGEYQVIIMRNDQQYFCTVRTSEYINTCVVDDGP